MLEVFNNLFMTIAEQMGLRLQNTAYSVNIKERLDFSCALFDADGNLIANAPHMPVHLGSMSESIKTVIRAERRQDAAGRRLRAERSVQRRHAPARRDRDHAGVRSAGQTTVLFYVGSRGHHADIGGITPGSMPPFSTAIEEEGVLIDNFLLVERRPLPRGGDASRCCARGPYPARNPAAEHRRPAGADRRQREGRAGAAARWSTQFGLDVVRAYMRHVQDNAEESVRRVIGALKDGAFALPLDNGARDQGRRSRVGRDRRSARRSTSPAPRAQLPNNFNAPAAVSMAAVLYVFRTLVDDDIPLNAGCLKPLEVIIPEGSMLQPALPGRGGRRQRRDLAVHHRRALRRARRDGRRRRAR